MLRLLKSRPIYARVAAALFISGIGTAFTSVAVYQELARRSIGAFGFGAAFAAGVLPGLFASVVAGSRARRWNPGRALICGQLIGLAGLLCPLIGSWNGKIGWLLAAEVTASAVGGLLIPVLKGLERSCCEADQFSTLAVLDTVLLTGNFVLGQGIGSLLASRLSLRGFLLCDVITYAAALALLVPLRAKIPAVAAGAPKARLKSILRADQKKALLILPWLALVCAPPMVLLPARAAEWGQPYRLFALVEIAPVLLLLCARTAGQILGPLLAARFDLSRLNSNRAALPGALSAYLGFYGAAFHASSLPWTAALVLAAHVSSNAVYAMGNYQLLRAFDSEEIIWASGWVYRAMTLITGLSGLLIGGVVSAHGLPSVLALCAAALGAGSFVLAESPSCERPLQGELA